jgi:hypothetical protein
LAQNATGLEDISGLFLFASDPSNVYDERLIELSPSAGGVGGRLMASLGKTLRSSGLTIGIAFAGSLAIGACGSDVEPKEGAPTPNASPPEKTIEQPTAPTRPDGPPGTITDGGTITSVDAGFDMRTWKPQAKGLWIWYLDYIGMTAAEAATKAKSLGVGYVLIKSGQDGTFWTTRFNANIVKEFTSRGMRVLAWPYITPSGGAAAVDAAAEAAKVPGCDGLVLDVELEWEKGTGRAAQAQQLCQGIRAKAPGVWLAYTSFGWVGYHDNFPFAAFDQYCGDAAFPQVYFSDRGVSWDGPKGLSEAIANYKAANLKAPMWPIGSNDDVYGTASGPTTLALNGFLAAAGPYVSLYEFPSEERPEKLTQLAQLLWPNP